MNPVYAACVLPGHDLNDVARGIKTIDPEYVRILSVTPIQEAAIIGIITFQCPEGHFGRVLAVRGIDSVNDETNYETSTRYPTPVMDELFQTSVKNFLDAKPSHRYVLAEGIGTSLPTVDRWSRGVSFAHLYVRPAILDWIWNHNCNCECP